MAELIEIIFIDSALASEFGAGKRKVSRSYADRCVAAGKARYANAQPVTNPDIEVTEEELEKIKSKYAKNKFMLEDHYISEVCWVTGSIIPQELLKAGYDFGFDIKLLNQNAFSYGDVIKTPFIILSSNLDHFSQMQLMQLKILLFQKKIPYIFRIEELSANFNKNWVKHCIVHSLDNFYISKDIYKDCVQQIGPEVKKKNYIEGKPMVFWRRVNSLMKEGK